MKPIKIFLVLGLLLSCFTENADAQQPMNTKELLDSKQQSIVTISAFTAKGDLLQLKQALNNGLNAGLTLNETKEMLVHLYAYTGFPRSLNAISTLEAVVNERKQKGIKDMQGKELSTIINTKNKFQFGKDVQTKLTGSTATGAPQKFAPIIDTFLKEHLFADIFSRDVLDYKTREIVTISALASLGGAESQLRSHFNVGLNTGLTEAQLKSIVYVLRVRVGSKESNTANEVLQSLLNKTGKMNPDDSNKQNAITIFPIGERITNNNFTGNAWLHQMIASDSFNATQVGNVTFEPGARTNWHLHPGGQILLITGGTGYYQERGSAKKIIKAGEVVTCAPNVPHWHGASKNEQLIQIAITNADKGSTQWLQPVTDEEYNKPADVNR